MNQELLYTIVQYLSKGNFMSRGRNFSIVKSWGEEGIQILLAIARGELPVDNPKVRTRALKLVAAFPPASEKARPLLEQLARKVDNPQLQLHAFSAWSLVEPEAAAAHAQAQIRRVRENPAIALAAARVLAARKERDAVPELKLLYHQVLEMAAGNRDSPTVLWVQSLMQRAEGAVQQPEKEPKQEV